MTTPLVASGYRCGYRLLNKCQATELLSIILYFQPACKCEFVIFGKTTENLTPSILNVKFYIETQVRATSQVALLAYFK